MSFYFVKTPSIIQRIFDNYTWCFSKSRKKTIYLTFDDGPTPEITNWTLETLKQYKAKATFFCIGKNVVKHPEIMQNIIENGHSIGNHTHNHLNGWKNTKTDYLNNIQEAEMVISSKLFRPPYGKIKSKQGNQLIKEGYQIIMWGVLSGDFDQNTNNKKCLNNVLKNTQNGSIVIFHDSVKAEKKLKYVLPKILKHFSNMGYSFSSIAQPN